MIDYVHLNPGRAGLVDGVEKSAGEYPGSSLASYLLPASQRPAWLVVPEVLDLFGLKDAAKGRREFVHRIDDWIRHEKGDPAVAGTSVEIRAKEGWFWGTESFKEAMLSFLEDKVKMKTRSGRNRTYQSSKLVKDHGERSAIAILESAAAHFRMPKEQLRTLLRCDHTRAAVAYRLYKETTVSQEWIAEALGMRSAPNVCQQIRKFRLIEELKREPKIRKWMKVQIF